MEKPLYGHNAKNLMKTDVREHDDSYEVEIELPGFHKDEVQLSLENGYLNITAAKGLDKDEKDKKSGKLIRQERYAGSMSRSFYVGEELTEEDIKAKLEHGVLSLQSSRKRISKPNWSTVSCRCRFRRRKQSRSCLKRSISPLKANRFLDSSPPIPVGSLLSGREM